jgi:hypothetical protein
MNGGALALVLALAAGTPEAGQYKIVRDSSSSQRKLWGLFCGKADAEQKSSVGKHVTVTLSGEEWKAKGAGRKFGTATCEGRTNPTLKPVDRKVKDGVISFNCRSQRVTRGTETTSHTVRVKDNGNIVFTTKGETEFRREGDLCRSTFERTTVAVPDFEKKQAAAEAPPEPVDPCAKPGAVTALVVSPKVFDVKVGGEPVCLRVTGKDANSCAVPAEGATFTVDPAEAGAVSDEGCFTPSDSIKEEEAIAIVIDLKGVEAAVSARIVPKALERAKKTLKALAKTSRSKRAQEILGEVTRGEITLRPLETEPPELPPLPAPPFPWATVAGAGGAAGLATILGVFLAIRRRRNRQEATELQAKPVVTPKKGGGLVCPQCKFEFAVGEATHCPFDNTALEELGRDARQTMFVPAAGGMVCPVCFTRYPTKARFCGHDRAPLVPDFGQFADQEPKPDQ